MAGRTDNEMRDQDLDQPATRRDLRAVEVSLREEIRAGDASLRDEVRAGDAALREELRQELSARDQRFERIDQRFDELRAHFDLTADNFRAEFRNLYDWTVATTSSLDARLDHVEKDHGTRLLSVETRVTRLERRRKSNRR